MKKIPLTVVIITKNEQQRIRDCLESVHSWAAEVIIVDDESTDSTREIAKDYAQRILVRKMDNEGRHRNWGYSQAENEWVLSLDADERVTPELQEEITQVLSDSPSYAAFTLPRKNFLGDYWLRWGGQYPAPQLKLFRKDKFKWEEAEVHPRAFLDGECGHLTQPLLHYTYRDFADFVKKLNNQTTLEAKKWVALHKVDPKKANYKMNLFHALWRCLDRFVRTYLAKKGWRDGFIGFMIAFFASLYQIISYAKYWEMQKYNMK